MSFQRSFQLFFILFLLQEPLASGTVAEYRLNSDVGLRLLHPLGHVFRSAGHLEIQDLVQRNKLCAVHCCLSVYEVMEITIRRQHFHSQTLEGQEADWPKTTGVVDAGFSHE